MARRVFADIHLHTYLSRGRRRFSLSLEICRLYLTSMFIVQAT